MAETPRRKAADADHGYDGSSGAGGGDGGEGGGDGQRRGEARQRGQITSIEITLLKIAFIFLFYI